MSYIRTPAHRKQQAERIRAWSPWKHSTGPRTAEGKQVSSRNAYKGGTRKMLRAIAHALTVHREMLGRVEAGGE